MNTAALLSVLETVKNTVDKRDVVPALQCVMFANDSAVTYNRSVGTKVTGVGNEIQGLIPFGKLYTFVKSVRAENVDVEENTDTVLKLKAGRASVSISLLDKSMFPEFTVINTIVNEQKEKFVVPPAGFLDGLRKCSMFSAVENFDSSGVYFSDKIVLSTDGKRISRMTLKTKIFPDTRQVVLSRDFILGLRGIPEIDSFYSDEANSIAIHTVDPETGKQVIVFGANMQVVFKIQANKFFPKAPELVEFPGSELVEGLKRIGDFSDEISEKKSVTIEFGDSLKLSYEGDTTEIKEYFNFGNTLYNKPFNVNPYHFVAMLNTCDMFSFCTEKTPLLYGASESEDNKFEVVIAIKDEK